MTLMESAQLLGNFGEFAGAIAVVGTLIYLAIQIRQSKKATEANTRSLRGTASWDAEIVFAHRNEKTSHDKEFSDLLQRAYDPNGNVNSWDQSERNQIMLDTLSCFQMVQAQYFLWREGSLPDDIWNYRSTWARRAVMLPVIAAFWQQFRSSDILCEPFMDYIDSIETREYAPFPTGLDLSDG